MFLFIWQPEVYMYFDWFFCLVIDDGRHQNVIRMSVIPLTLPCVPFFCSSLTLRNILCLRFENNTNYTTPWKSKTSALFTELISWSILFTNVPIIYYCFKYSSFYISQLFMKLKILQIIMNKKHKMVQEINLYLSLNSKLVFTVWW